MNGSPEITRLRRLTPGQREVVEALSVPGAFIASRATIWTGTRYRLGGEGRSFPARTLWSLVDRGEISHTVVGGRDRFLARDDGAAPS